MAQFEVLNSYVSLTTTPIPNGGSPNNLQFYSAPSSPLKGEESEEIGPCFDEFEFKTSKKFDNLMEFEVSENFKCPLEEQVNQEKPNRERGGSLPTMAFADELFANGVVMPLKPPPRLQSWNDQRCFSQGSIPGSPKPPTSRFKNPFARRAAWNDDFDPFKVALEKVSEEKRGRSSNVGSQHRRTRSHSPFRTSNDSGSWNQENSGLLEKVRNSGSQLINMPKELKGSPYARWVLDQSKQVEQLSPKANKRMLKGFTFVTRVGPVKSDNEGSKIKAIFGDQEEGTNATLDTKVKKIKGILQRYASFRRESSEEKSTIKSSKRWGSTNYLKKFSFKVKRNASENGENRVVVQKPKVAIVEYKRNKPTLTLCFYGIESPRNIK